MAWIKKVLSGVLEKLVAGFLLWIITTFAPLGVMLGMIAWWWESIKNLHPFYLIVGSLVAFVAMQWALVGAVYLRRFSRFRKADSSTVSVPDIVPHRPYDSAWVQWDILPLWQVACLWAGEEPFLPIAHGTKPYPHLKIMEGAIVGGTLRTMNRDHDEKAWWLVGREDLMEYVNKAGFSPRPSFLFPDG